METRPIPGFSEHYLATDQGTILNMKFRKPRELKGTSKSVRGGYVAVTLSIDGEYKPYRMNVLICSAFHGRCPRQGMVACHKNHNKRDNRPSNLKWAWQVDNIQDGYAVGREGKGNQRLTQEQIDRIAELNPTSWDEYDLCGLEMGVSGSTVQRVALRLRREGKVIARITPPNIDRVIV